jgi:NADPH2:quinone reductase
LFHAAAGGVGLIACQWLSQIGAIVIGTAGGDEKTALARAHGCAHVIDYRQEGEKNIAAKVREITAGRGVAVAYDSVGKDTYDATLDSLATRGMFVSFGNASGPVESISPPQLAQKGSLFFTRPTLMHYAGDDDEMQQSAAALFAAYRKGITVEIKQRFALQDAARAHRALEARATTGSTILLP